MILGSGKLTSSVAGANSAVTGILCVAANVADSGVQDGVLGEVVAVHVFDAPEASGRDGGPFGAFGDVDGAAAAFGGHAHGG